jgi:hypothetical protein
LPNPPTDREKITANIMELHNPTAMMVQTATFPVVLIEVRISKEAKAATPDNTKEGFNYFKTKAPINRPISIPPQYKAT